MKQIKVFRKETCGHQRGEGGKEKEIKNMKLTDANYHTQNRWATRIYHLAQGAIFNIF